MADSGDGTLRDGCASPLPKPGCSVTVEVSNGEAMLELLRCMERLLDAAKQLVVITVTPKAGKAPTRRKKQTE